MRVAENTPERLVLKHSPWATSAICWFVILGIAVKLPWHLWNLTLPDLPIMIAGIAIAVPVAWWLARWSTFTFDRKRGELTIAEQFLPFVDFGRRQRTVPLAAITDVALQSVYDDAWMWRAAVIADPARLPAESVSSRDTRIWLRRHHFLVDADGEFPLVPYYTSSEAEWSAICAALRKWLGLQNAALTV